MSRSLQRKRRRALWRPHLTRTARESCPWEGMTSPFRCYRSSSGWSTGRAARYDSVLLPWPTLIFKPWMQNRPEAEQRPQGYLIGDDCPSFPCYEAAFRAFFYGDFSRSPGGQVPSAFSTVRFVDSRAWLERVRISPTTLDVRLGGSHVQGARVELNSQTYRCDARAAETGQVTLLLPDALPPGAWLYLSRDRRWLDYRAIGEYASSADLAGAGVDVEIPEDPESEIQALLSRGEGQQVEFKRQLPDDSAESKRTVFKTAAAFANGGGGSIVFGVEKDEATVCGLDGIDLITERDRLAQLARSIVTPVLDVEVRSYERDGKTLLVLAVGCGTDPPYGITLPGRKDKPVEFYVRRDATTFPARPEEMQERRPGSSPTARDYHAMGLLANVKTVPRPPGDSRFLTCVPTGAGIEAPGKDNERQIGGLSGRGPERSR
jgi:hypothetical protein